MHKIKHNLSLLQVKTWHSSYKFTQISRYAIMDGSDCFT